MEPSEVEALLREYAADDDYIRKDGSVGTTNRAVAMTTAADTIAALRQKCAELEADHKRLEFACNNPELAKKNIDAAWANCGRGFREVFFDFRWAIDSAMSGGKHD